MHVSVTMHQLSAWLPSQNSARGATRCGNWLGTRAHVRSHAGVLTGGEVEDQDAVEELEERAWHGAVCVAVVGVRCSRGGGSRLGISHARGARSVEHGEVEVRTMVERG